MRDTTREPWELDHDEFERTFINVGVEAFRNRKEEASARKRQAMAVANVNEAKVAEHAAWQARLNITADELLEGIPEVDDGVGILDRPDDFLDAYYGDW